MIDVLIAKGADMNATDAETGSTPVHLAASWGRTEALAALLKQGADPTIPNKSGVTPLAAAVANGHTEAAEHCSATRGRSSACVRGRST